PKRTVALDDGTAEEDRRLAEKADALQPLVVEWLDGIRFDDAIGLVNMIRLAVDDIDITMSLEDLQDSRARSRIVDIVGIQPAEHGAGGPLEAFVDGIGLTGIRLADGRQAPCIFAKDGGGSVGAGSVVDEVLESGHILGQNAFNRDRKSV